MESPPLARYVLRSSKKRVFPGGSSVDDDVVEVPPPINRTSRALKQKEIITHDIIDVDIEEDYNSARLSKMSCTSNGKGKEMVIDLSLGPHGGSVNTVAVKGVQTSKKNFTSGSQNVINIDDSYELYEDNEKVTSRSGSTIWDRTRKKKTDATDSSVYTDSKHQGSLFVSSQVHPSLHGLSQSKGKKNVPHGATSFFSHSLSPPMGSSFPNVVMKSFSPDWTNFLPNSTNHSTTVPSVPPSFLAGSVPGHLPPVGVFSSVLPSFLSGSVPGHLPPVGHFPVTRYTANKKNAPVPVQSASSGTRSENIDDIIERFRAFKKFDTVQDSSDHHYHRHASKNVNTASKAWVKRVQEEWKVLEKDLPDTIFVRVYESRMDLLRAVIIGAVGTPYHDGLFFFDVFFPSNYPNVPPQVHYHSGGLRINPNLYNSGKVCLSLLNTWSGRGNEKWVPRESTMLQVLVSIQGLILNAKPYFNEPGYAGSAGTASGENKSLQYNENTYISNLRTMVYSIRKPPKHFEDFVVGHFVVRAQDILLSCKTYVDGAPIGSLVSGGVQDVDEGGISSSVTFKHSIAGFIKILVESFTQVGAKDCDKFLYLEKPSMPLPAPINYHY